MYPISGLNDLFLGPKYRKIPQNQQPFCVPFQITPGPTLARAMCALNTTLLCQNGASKGDDKMEKGFKVIPFIVINHHNSWLKKQATRTCNLKNYAKSGLFKADFAVF